MPTFEITYRLSADSPTQETLEVQAPDPEAASRILEGKSPGSILEALREMPEQRTTGINWHDHIQAILDAATEDQPVPSPKSFRLGALVATPNAISSVGHTDIMAALARHGKGDWGDVCKEDWRANDQALREGTGVLSAYRAIRGCKFWIITEADRSVTTVLLPEDY